MFSLMTRQKYKLPRNFKNYGRRQRTPISTFHKTNTVRANVFLFFANPVFASTGYGCWYTYDCFRIDSILNDELVALIFMRKCCSVAQSNCEVWCAIDTMSEKKAVAFAQQITLSGNAECIVLSGAVIRYWKTILNEI